MKVIGVYSIRAIRAWCATGSAQRPLDELLMAFDSCEYCLDAVDPVSGSHWRLGGSSHTTPSVCHR